MNGQKREYGFVWGSRDAQENGIYELATGRILVPADALTSKQRHVVMCDCGQEFYADIVRRYEARWK